MLANLVAGITVVVAGYGFSGVRGSDRRRRWALGLALVAAALASVLVLSSDLLVPVLDDDPLVEGGVQIEEGGSYVICEDKMFPQLLAFGLALVGGLGIAVGGGGSTAGVFRRSRWFATLVLLLAVASWVLLSTSSAWTYCADH